MSIVGHRREPWASGASHLEAPDEELVLIQHKLLVGRRQTGSRRIARCDPEAPPLDRCDPKRR